MENWEATIVGMTAQAAADHIELLRNKILSLEGQLEQSKRQLATKEAELEKCQIANGSLGLAYAKSMDREVELERERDSERKRADDNENALEQCKEKLNEKFKG